MKYNELRQLFFEFFASKKHKILPSASLIPENDPSVLFTTAGMHPLAPYLLGQKHPMGKRLCNIQKCVRTDDINEIGDDTHLTFFEMMGNWSLGDYWKQEAIQFAFEFLTKYLNIKKSDLSVTCFAGDKDASKDIESAKIWKQLGISSSNIKFLGKKDNWWGPTGSTGPCGPDSEIFYKGVEIWNLVFMQYNKIKHNNRYIFTKLKQRNIDTGMGLERMLMLLNGKKNVYETELFYPIVSKLEKYSEKEKRIIADHIKACVFIIADNVMPSNVGQGYVLRKLMRRAMRYKSDITDLVEPVTQIYKHIYPELNQNNIEQVIRNEQDKFGALLLKGIKKLHMLNTNRITGKQAFDLYQTYGLPLEVMQEEVAVDKKEFLKEFKKHQDLSRSTSGKKFKAGLADNQEQTIKLHTATHLLLAGLRKILDNTIKQAGSNITPERLRFDFTYNSKLTDEQIKSIEDFVNEKINNNLPVTYKEMPLSEAEAQGAVATFKARYPDYVRVYSIGDCSKEICAGPHVKNTSELGKFKIIKQESSSAGVRRIRAILE